MTARIELVNATIRAPGGRPLFEDLSLRLSAEHVALVGRNGIGKSLLLSTLAGIHDPDVGEVVVRGKHWFVAHALDGRVEALSSGEHRWRALMEAQRSCADVLLLDEPTDDLDEARVAEFRQWLGGFPGCVLVASHDRRLLGDFRHFFVASESGCRYFGGTLAELEDELTRAHDLAERHYARGLARLVAREEHTAHVTRRRARKKRFGRVSELDRATPKIRLNQKRSNAQVYQGKFAKIREQRLEATRQWSKAARRALSVKLALELPAIALPDETGDTLVLRDISLIANGRELFASLSLHFGRRRVAVLGPNGSGKTSLLNVMVGERRASSGTVLRDLSKIGVVVQGGREWQCDEPLIERLRMESAALSLEDAARVLTAHRFPLALAERPMRTLSPGERARAALLCLFHRRPAVELLVLDEPTHGLDLLGQRALVDALRRWPGGLVVTSHDTDFVQAVGFEETIALGGNR